MTNAKNEVNHVLGCKVDTDHVLADPYETCYCDVNVAGKIKTSKASIKL